MARIRTYELDTNITANDHLLGNDGDSGSVITKRFALDDLKEFIESGVNLPQEVPYGFVPYVNARIQTDANGQEFADEYVDRSLTRIEQVNGLALLQLTNADATITVHNDGINGFTLQFQDFNDPVELASLVGATFNNAISTQNRGYTFSGTISSYNGHENSVNGSAIDVYDTFTITLDSSSDNIDQPVITLDSIDIVDIIRLRLHASNLTIDDDLLVVGTSQFDSEVTIGSDDPDERVNLIVHGSIHLDDDQGGLIFGEDPRPETPADYVSFTTDGTNLTTGGNGTINFGNNLNVLDGFDMNFEGGDITFQTNGANPSLTIGADGITQLDEDGNQLPDIKAVQANEITSTPAVPAINQGTLTTVQVGDEYWNIPVAQSQTAFVLPGLHEDLSAPSVTFDTTAGAFFYGDDLGTSAAFESNVTDPGVVSITTGSTTSTITDAAIDTALTDLFANVPYSQRLFFVQDPTVLTGLTAGDAVTGVVYEVVSYISISGGVTQGTLTFTEIGAGNLVISAPQVSVTNLPQANENANTFIFLDPSTGDLSQSTVQEIAGVQSQVRYDIDNDPTNDDVLNSVQFNSSQRDHVVTETSVGNISIDVSGRVPIFADAARQLAGFSAVDWSAYVLGTIGAQQTVTLPAGNVLGDTIRLYNLSTISSVDGSSISSETWRVIPSAGERIMNLPIDEELLLDTPAITIDLVWAGSAIGWITNS